jgi:ABC-type antimicrobial peptide transport system permease subunit
VNEQFARTYFPNQDPLGSQIRLSTDDKDPWLTIIGVAGSEKRTVVYQEMTYVEPALVYLPFEQSSGTSMGLVVKVAGNPLALSASLHREISALDPEVPLYDVKTMSQRYFEFLAYPRFRASLMGTLAGLTLLLSAIGFYGVLSHAVAQRTHEIGVRMALGAQRAEVLRMVALRGTKLAIIGIGSGTIAGLILTRAMASLLYGVGASDPTTFASAAGLLILVALLACYLPARRAAQVDPIVALRCQ